MATTHDMRYESQDSRQDTKKSNWSWLLPLALLLLGAIALSSYLANRNDPANQGGVNSGANTELNSGVNSGLNTTQPTVSPF